MHPQYVHTAAQESVAPPFHWNCWPCFVQYLTFFLWCECRDTFPWGEILPFWKVTMAAIICWSVPKLALQTIELAQSWYMPLSKLPEMCSCMYLNCKYRMLPSDGEQTKVTFLTRWYWGFLGIFYFYVFVTMNAALQATCVCVMPVYVHVWYLMRTSLTTKAKHLLTCQTSFPSLQGFKL